MTLLRELRKKTGKSGNTFAIENGIEPATLSLVERGKRPCKRTANRLAAALGIKPEKLFPGYTTFRGEG